MVRLLTGRITGYRLPLLIAALVLLVVQAASADAPPLEAAMISLDHQNFPFIYLSVAVARFGEGISTLTKSNFQVTEDGSLQTDYFDVIPPETGGGVRAVDIVFLMDNSGSMDVEQSTIRNHMKAFVDELVARGIDYQLGLCRFGAWENSGNPMIEDNGTLTSNPDYFKDDVWNRNVISGGFEPGWDALYEAVTGFAFRGGAQKVFILITDETPTDNGNIGTHTQEEAIAILQDHFVTAFALIELSDAHAIADYGAIAQQTNGEYYDILEPLDGILDYISNLIANNYRITYKSSRPVFDGVERRVVVTVSYSGDQATCEGTYVPGSAPRIQRTQETLDLHGQSWAAGTPFNIRAEITDAMAPYVQSATVYYRRTGDVDYTPSPMTHSSDIWSGAIPGAAVKTPGVDYYIVATDGQSTVTDPSTDPRTHPHQLAVLPNVAPQITHTPPTDVPINAPVTMTAQVIDTTNVLASVRMYYRKVGQLIYQCNGAMTNTAGDSYHDTIPSDYVTPAGVEYYIHAEDDLGVGSYSGTPDNPHQITVSTNQPPDTKIETAEIDESEGTAKFTWSGSDDTTPAANLVYCYRLVEDSSYSEWSSWSSGKSKDYANLVAGEYKFQVRAKDADEAIDPSPASREFGIGEEARGTISGRVTDASIPGPSNGIVGAVLLLGPDPFTYCATTDANGRFSFSIPPGTYSITASAEGYVSKTAVGVVVVAGAITSLDFALDPSSVAWVRTNRDGVLIYDEDAAGNPNTAMKLKQLPLGWVLQRFIEGGKPMERSPDGGITWYNKVQDVTDGMVGWVERGDLDEGGDRSRVRILLLQNDHPGGFTFERNLYRDMSNAEEDIRLLQAVLKEEGSAIYPEGLITGYFGARTETAVKRFQEKYTEEILDPIGRTEGTGYVGPRTRIKLNQLLSNIPFREKYELARGRASIVLGELQEHRPADFPIPIQLVLAVIAQEIGADLDNELVSYDCGRGLMQLTSNEAVGEGSGIECYFNNKACLPYLHKAWWENYGRSCCHETQAICLTAKCLCYHTSAYRCMHYTNSAQGMAANIEDGLGWLRGRYEETACSQDSLGKVAEGTELSCDEYRIIDAIWRYNGRLISSKECQGHRYLLCVADRLSSLRDYFPYEDEEFAATWGPKLVFVASRPHTMLAVKSPAEVRVYDSEGQVAGVVNGDVKEDIPFSSYDRKLRTVVVAFSYGSYRYQVVGTGAGTYGLEAVYAEGGTEIAFNAGNIPILEGSVHEYVVEWDVLARGEDGVALQVDNDGDGTFEKTIHAGSTLDGTTTPIANQLPELSILAPTEGEVITGQIYRIRWEATDSDNDASDLSIDIELSSNGEVSWTTLTSNKANDGSYEWDISGLEGGEYWLKILAEDPEGAAAEATTGPFTIISFEGTIIIGPNPVTGDGTAFFYTLPEGTSTAKLMVFNAVGRPVFETPLDVSSSRFPDTGAWNPVDQDGVLLGNGPYVYVLIADGKVIGQGKMVVQQ